MFAPGQLGYTADAGYPTYDLAKAKQLVADYTAETGQPLSFTFLNTSSIDDTKTSQTLKDMWEQAGMKISLENVGEQDEVVAVVLGKYQAADWRNFGQPDPDGDYLWWHSSSVGKGADISLNTARYATPEIDKALDGGPGHHRRRHPRLALPGGRASDQRRCPLRLVRPGDLCHRRRQAGPRLRRRGQRLRRHHRAQDLGGQALDRRVHHLTGLTG